MTLKDLSDAILALPTSEQNHPALVWPPMACPAAKPVEIIGFAVLPGPLALRILSTGKSPLQDLPADRPTPRPRLRRGDD